MIGKFIERDWFYDTYTILGLGHFSAVTFWIIMCVNLSVYFFFYLSVYFLLLVSLLLVCHLKECFFFVIYDGRFHSNNDHHKFVSILYFSCGLFSSGNKTDHHDITEILLKVALNTINKKKQSIFKNHNQPSCIVIALLLILQLLLPHLMQIINIYNIPPHYPSNKNLLLLQKVFLCFHMSIHGLCYLSRGDHFLIYSPFRQ